jgi:Tol biopolymer transport system component
MFVRLLGYEAGYDNRINWMPDSSHFIALVADDPYEEDILRQLILFDYDGNLVNVVITIHGYLSFQQNRDWSPDGRYLSFRIKRDGPLYIADVQERRIINTCLTEIGSGAAWSPDSTQLALIAPGDDIQYVFVLDMETYTLHPVARHDKGYGGSIIGWRESE